MRSIAPVSEDVRLLQAVEVSDDQDLAAGGFSAWLDASRYALAERAEADVPCAECNACCRSSYFIHIEPQETEALAHIPEEVLFAAPGHPEGHVLMGYDHRGHCPMLVDDACSIYEYRPRTCRNYDCRIFPAAGIDAAEDSKDLVAARAARWKFDHRSEREFQEHAAVQAAARFLRVHSEFFAGEAGNNSTRTALFAIKVSDVFLQIHDDYAESGLLPSDAEIVAAVTQAIRKFDAGEAG
jgi:Fe-S-cluster containining protein